MAKVKSKHKHPYPHKAKKSKSKKKVEKPMAKKAKTKDKGRAAKKGAFPGTVMQYKSQNTSVVLNPSQTQNSSQITSEDLDPDRIYRVYADGIFDVFHYGHARALKQAKEVLPDRNVHLVVGVCTDEDTQKYKGPAVMSLDERVECVSHCKWVDEVIRGSPWFLDQDFIDTHKLDFVCHGEDPCIVDGKDVYQFVKDQGKMLTIKRTPGISTSDLIARIVRNTDTYLLRNLIRGMSREDLNISLLKEWNLKLSGEVDKVRKKMKNRISEVLNDVDTSYNLNKNRVEMRMKKVPKHIMGGIKGIRERVGRVKESVDRSMKGLFVGDDDDSGEELESESESASESESEGDAVSSSPSSSASL